MEEEPLPKPTIDWKPPEIQARFTLSETAQAPKRMSSGAAAWDLFADAPEPPLGSWICAQGKITTISTGVRLELPKDTFALILPRSGLAAKRGFTIVNAPGLIDSDYRGELKVIATLLGPVNAYWEVAPGTRIAQLLILPQERISLLRAQELTPTARGEKGLGSTGE